MIYYATFQIISGLFALAVVCSAVYILIRLVKATHGREKKILKSGGIGLVIFSITYLIGELSGLFTVAMVSDILSSISILIIFYGVKIFLDNISPKSRNTLEFEHKEVTTRDD